MTNTPDKSELLPCPFCGGETVRRFHPFEQRGYVIDCNRCNGGFHNIPKDQAVKRWNTRASSRPPADQVPDMVERVARALCEDNGDDPDDLDNSRICKTDGTPLPLWAAYESAAIAALQAVPGGEPTDAMIKAAASVAHERGCYGVTRPDLSAIIRAALGKDGSDE